ncbi:hypothetical protein POM88_018514 [Heracleum sosnowskyi]|uniref:UBA domain-containing protein n=1 Tax=Heracleum sosnowskyi TaxID=360622 RepID=A0AAD8IRL0_9APIA|nr:hypothetical protein POM88_018514 [Heracleum sosnowskyi]
MSPNGVKDPSAASGSNANKAYLLQMEFSLYEVDLAMDKLGEDAPIDELVDFISATHIAEETEKDAVWTNHCHEEKNEDSDVSGGLNTIKEILLQMNFSLDEVNSAIAKLGVDTPIERLVNYIIDSGRAEESKNDVCADYCNEERNEENMDNEQQLLQMGFSEQQVSAAFMINGLDKSLPELVESIISAQATSFNKNSSRSSSLILSEPAHKPRLFGGPKGMNIGLKDKGKMKMIIEEDEEEEEDDDDD